MTMQHNSKTISDETDLISPTLNPESTSSTRHSPPPEHHLTQGSGSPGVIAQHTAVPHLHRDLHTIDLVIVIVSYRYSYIYRKRSWLPTTTIFLVYLPTSAVILSRNTLCCQIMTSMHCHLVAEQVHVYNKDCRSKIINVINHPPCHK